MQKQITLTIQGFMDENEKIDVLKIAQALKAAGIVTNSIEEAPTAEYHPLTGEKRKVQILISAPSGSGKNAMALRLAQQLAGYDITTHVRLDEDMSIDPADIEEVHQGLGKKVEVEIVTRSIPTIHNYKKGN